MNNKKLLVSVLTLIMSLVFAGSALAEDSQSDFFKEGATSRSFAMGSTGVSISNDADAVYWNPAGLAQLKHPQMLISKTNLQFFDSDVQSFTAAVPFKSLTVGLSYVSSSTDFPLGGGLDASGRPIFGGIDSDKYTGTAISFGGKVHENVMAGLSIKHMSHKLYTNSESGTGFDLGLLGKWDDVSAGLVLQNLGGVNLSNDEVPTNIRIGVSGELLEDALLLAASYDSNYLGESGFGVGVEYKVVEQFVVRAGSYDGDFAYGFGVNISNFQIDYSLTSGADVTETNKITIGYTFVPMK